MQECEFFLALLSKPNVPRCSPVTFGISIFNRPLSPCFPNQSEAGGCTFEGKNASRRSPRGEFRSLLVLLKTQNVFATKQSVTGRILQRFPSLLARLQELRFFVNTRSNVTQNSAERSANEILFSILKPTTFKQTTHPQHDKFFLEGAGRGEAITTI